MSTYPEGYPPAPPRQGSNTALTVVLIVGGVLGVFALICCGVGGWIAYQGVQVASSISEQLAQVVPTADPVKVRATTQEIADVTMPDDLSPLMSWDMMGAMKIVVYGQQGTSDHMLMLMQFSDASAGGNPEQMKAEFERSMNQQGQQNAQVKVIEQHDRELTVRGETVAFEFVKGIEQNTGTEVWQVQGAFTGKGGPTMLMMVVPTADWSEERIVEFIQSIK